MHHTRHGNVDVFGGEEPLTGDNAPDLVDLFEQRSGAGQPHVVFDLAKTPFLDSAGLEVLLDLRDTCLQRGGALKLAGPNALCRDVLRLTEVDRSFDVHDDAVSAAGSFAR